MEADSLFQRLRRGLTSNDSVVHEAEENMFITIRRLRSHTVVLKHEDVLQIEAGLTTVEELEKERASKGQERVKMLQMAAK